MGDTTKKAKVKQDPAEVEKVFVAARQKDLNAMYVADLRELVLSKNLEKGDKATMIERLLALEAKARQEARVQEDKVNAVLAEMQKDLEGQGNEALKELCRAKELALGGSKTDKIDRLFEAAKKRGDVDRVLEKKALEVRHAELLTMSKEGLFELCQQKGVDPLVQEVMVERILLASA